MVRTVAHIHQFFGITIIELLITSISDSQQRIHLLGNNTTFIVENKIIPFDIHASVLHLLYNNKKAEYGI